MIDENEPEEDRRLKPTHCVITEPGDAPGVELSLTNHSSISISRTFIPLPIKLEPQTFSDKTVCGAHLQPARKGLSTAKKGFSSVTITSRRCIASLSHVPKEIISDPASSLGRTNDLLMKATFVSHEHDQQCRYLEYYSQASEPCGHFHFKKATHGHLNNNRNKDSRTFISSVYIKKAQTFPGKMYYIDKSFFLPLGHCHGTNPRIYKSTMSFKIHPRQARPTGDCENDAAKSPVCSLIQELTFLFLTGRGNRSRTNHELQPSKQILQKKCTYLQGHQHRQEEPKKSNCHEECKDVSPNFNTKAFGFSTTLNKGLQPVCEIYPQQDHQPSGSNHLGPQRSTVTTFNYIFGKQITKCVKNRQNLPQETMPLKEFQYTRALFMIQKSVLLGPLIVLKGLDLWHAEDVGRARQHCGDCFSIYFDRRHHESLIIMRQHLVYDPVAYSNNQVTFSCSAHLWPSFTLTVQEFQRLHKSSGYFDKENIPFPEIIGNNKSKNIPREIMSLQEALEHHRPDFICNSQKRVHKLEVKVLQRKTQKQKSDILQGKPSNLKRKMFTVPHPLSDNLFKPKERAISNREMQQRSRRIYNSLPEVKKKKEEEERRIIIENNRLRAQLFKKKVLDQILQRSSD
ncbi:(E2-independent) E3 ubiquitin-conjugating enzyme FATS [Gastrophryne carolinensis]